jgi:hypothetical protein
MTQIAADPQAHKNLRVKIGANNFELHVSNVNFTRTPPKPVSWQGGTPAAVYTDSTPSVDHLCNITVVHDYQNEDSAYNFLRGHEGEQAEIQYKPDADGAYTETSTITLVGPNPGGAYGAFGESTVACPSTPPVRTFDDAAAPTITELAPDTGDAAGGNPLVITGTGFSSATSVTVDGDSVEFTIITAGIILVDELPAHAAGAVDVIVVNPTGSSSAEEYTYA